MAKFTDITTNLNPSAQKIYDDIIAAHGNYRWPGLWPMMINYPELAERFSALTVFLRSSGKLNPYYREFTILTVAARLKVAFEFDTHIEPATKAGLSPALIEKIQKQQGPFNEDELFIPIITLIGSLLELQVVPQPIHDTLIKTLGAEPYLQLILIIGMYRLIASFVIGFEFDLPVGMTDPFLNPEADNISS